MNMIVIVAIIVGGLILALAIVGSTILIALKIFRGGVSRKGQQMESEEAGMIQEIYQGLSKMEKRIEAIETIILEKDGKDHTS